MNQLFQDYLVSIKNNNNNEIIYTKMKLLIYRKIRSINKTKNINKKFKKQCSL